MSIINKNKICLNYLIGVLICGFVIGGIFVYAIDLYLILGLVLMVDTAIIYVNKR